MYYVYMLLCGDRSLYTGITNDLNRRLKAHQSGKGGHYTKSHLPVTLVYAEPAGDKSAALRRELAVKALRRSEKLQLISAPENPYRAAADSLISSDAQPAVLTDDE